MSYNLKQKGNYFRGCNQIAERNCPLKLSDAEMQWNARDAMEPLLHLQVNLPQNILN